MPTAPLRYCAEPGCPEKGTGARCDVHQQQTRQQQRRHYSTTPGVNYGRKWQTARRAFLADHPFCVDCETEGQQTLATEVDHIVPHRGDRDLFWDRTNWASRCKPHHSAKTRRER